MAHLWSLTIRITTKLVRDRGDQPAAKLGFAATPLAAFFHALGQAMFGERWVEAPNPMEAEPNRVGLLGPVARTMQVVDQIRLGLQTKELTAALNIRLPSRKPSETDDLAFDDDEDADRHYPIVARAWDVYWPTSVTNWATSEMAVLARHIQVAEGRADHPGSRILGSLNALRPDLHYPVDHVLNGPVIILRAESALRSLLPLAPLPTPAQAERFRSFRNRLLDEVVAAAWRAIALHGPLDGPLQPKFVLQCISDYMTAQDIDNETNKLSEKTCEVIARKIVRQWNDRSTASCVLLNSSPLKPPSPPL